VSIASTAHDESGHFTVSSRAVLQPVHLPLDGGGARPYRPARSRAGAVGTPGGYCALCLRLQRGYGVLGWESDGLGKGMQVRGRGVRSLLTTIHGEECVCRFGRACSGGMMENSKLGAGMPNLSVVTISRDDPRDLAQALASLEPLLSQAFWSWEHVLVGASPAANGSLLDGLAPQWPLVRAESAPASTRLARKRVAGRSLAGPAAPHTPATDWPLK